MKFNFTTSLSLVNVQFSRQTNLLKHLTKNVTLPLEVGFQAWITLPFYTPFLLDFTLRMCLPPLYYYRPCDPYPVWNYSTVFGCVTNPFIFGPSEIVTELGKIKFTLEFLGENRNSETLGNQYFVMQELGSYRYPGETILLHWTPLCSVTKQNQDVFMGQLFEWPLQKSWLLLVSWFLF